LKSGAQARFAIQVVRAFIEGNFRSLSEQIIARGLRDFPVGALR
jgi:hypothetical protein